MNENYFRQSTLFTILHYKLNRNNWYNVPGFTYVHIAFLFTVLDRFVFGGRLAPGAVVGE